MADADLRLGIDLGGTKTELIALDAMGEELLRERTPTPAHDYGEILRTIRGLVTAAESRLGRSGSVGVATPGATSPASGRLKNSNTLCLNGKPLREDLARELERPVRLENDANCFALSEAVDGNAQDAAVVFGVILGTGVGGGVVVHREAITGSNAIGGEWGHNPLPWPRSTELPGPACYCGRHGCIETFLAGPSLARNHRERTGQSLRAEEVAAGAATGQEDCVATLDEYFDRAARALAHVINLLDPDVIVLGGGVSNLSALYTEIPRRWGPYVFSDTVDTRLVPPKHGDSSGVRGAAWLWPLDALPRG